MNQSALIGGALLAGFVLFLAARNRLTVYQSVLWGPKPESHSADGSGGSGFDIGETAGSAIGGAIGGPGGAAAGKAIGSLF